MDFDIFNLGIIISAFIAGGLTAMAVKRGEIRDLEAAKNRFRDAFNTMLNLFNRERDLNEGLQQELAVAAKLIK